MSKRTSQVNSCSLVKYKDIPVRRGFLYKRGLAPITLNELLPKSNIDDRFFSTIDSFTGQIVSIRLITTC